MAQGDIFDGTRAMHTGVLVMQIGPHFLLMPPVARTAKLDRLHVDWRDTLETRRAVTDVSPLMSGAEVTLAEVGAEGHMETASRKLDDVVASLMQYSVSAKSYPVSSTGDEAADLHAAADRAPCDVIVAGASVHSRVRDGYSVASRRIGS